MMRVSADGPARMFGNDVDATFGDMDANGEHGLALCLIAEAIESVLPAEWRDRLCEHIAGLVRDYEARTEPFMYV